jgi:hypothetical protein
MQQREGNKLHIPTMFFFIGLDRMLEVAYLPFFLYYGTLIFDVGQGKLA